MAQRKTELPSEKAARQKREKAELAELKNAQSDRLMRDLAMTFKTDHGLRVLKWIHDECGFGQPILGADAAGDIDKERTVYGAMRLNFYIKIRKLLPFNILKEVEYHENK